MPLRQGTRKPIQRHIAVLILRSFRQMRKAQKPGLLWLSLLLEVALVHFDVFCGLWTVVARRGGCAGSEDWSLV